MAWLFFSNPNACVSRETISLAVWGTQEEITSRTMEQHVYKLRKKLKLDGQHEVVLRTCYAQGYKLEVLQAATTGLQGGVQREEEAGRVQVAATPLRGRAKAGTACAVRETAAALVSLPMGFFHTPASGLASLG